LVRDEERLLWPLIARSLVQGQVDEKFITWTKVKKRHYGPLPSKKYGAACMAFFYSTEGKLLFSSHKKLLQNSDPWRASDSSFLCKRQNSRCSKELLFCPCKCYYRTSCFLSTDDLYYVFYSILQSGSLLLILVQVPVPGCLYRCFSLYSGS